MRAGWRGFLIAGLLSLGSAGAAQAEDAPRLDCGVRALPIGAPEVNGIRVQCQLSGAPVGDTHFSVQAAPGPDDGAGAAAPRLVCDADLSGGGGVCTGTLIDRDGASPAFGNLLASSSPSGVQVPLSNPPAATPPPPSGDGAPVEYHPLPDAEP
jgi:hypothetical protein